MKKISLVLCSLLFLAIANITFANSVAHLHLTAVKPLETSLIKGKLYDVSYRLTNHSHQPQSYIIAPLDNKQWHVDVLNNDLNHCDLKNHQTILAPESECTLKLHLTAYENVTQLDIKNILSINADVAITSATTAKYHNMIVFGDSLSDIKGKATNNDPTGKKLWDEFLYDDLDTQLAQRNGIHSYPASQQTPDCDNANNCNIVYAVGGNTTKNLAAQIDRYKAQLHDHTANAGTIAFIWLGGNDFNAFAEFKDDPIQAVERIKKGIEILKDELHVKADHIYLMNLPNINKMPLLAGDSMEDKLKRAAAVTTVALYNGSVKNLAEAEGVNLINIQSNDTHIHNNLAANGFDVIATEKQQSCSGSAPNKQTCKSDNGYFMYWDTVHPTVYTHRLIAQYVLSQL